MNTRPRGLLHSVEGWIVVAVPMLTILFGAAMIHVAARFGFTAMGEPVVAAAPAHE